jgi:hypothetical protein
MHHLFRIAHSARIIGKAPHTTLSPLQIEVILEITIDVFRFNFWTRYQMMERSLYRLIF